MARKATTARIYAVNSIVSTNFNIARNVIFSVVERHIKYSVVSKKECNNNYYNSTTRCIIRVFLPPFGFTIKLIIENTTVIPAVTKKSI